MRVGGRGTGIKSVKIVHLMAQVGGVFGVGLRSGFRVGRSGFGVV